MRSPDGNEKGVVEVLKPFLEIRMADVVDILLVTVLLYAALALIRRTRAGFVAMGILIVAALYVGARALNLQLTAWIFQGFFAVFLLIVVVIFQEELRQLFERIALWSLGRRELSASSADSSDTVVTCLADFARQKIGALVIFPGTQPIQRQIQGGIELQGTLSIPLLKSLFDPHSPGHDGAVIIENDRVARFAVHLPLSQDFRQLAGVGTRHSAALGLAERTDALCIVVSEERGEISIARDGHLKLLRSPQEAGRIIQGFLREKRPPEDRAATWKQLVRTNLTEKAVVLGLVIALWYLFVPGSRPVEFTYEIPVSVRNLPPGFEVESIDPKNVEATFTGLRRSFYLFRPERLEATIDAALVKLGRRTFELSHQNLQYPKDLTLREIQPDKVKLTVRERSEQEGTQPSEPDPPLEPKSSIKDIEGK